jgi:hypothetical protein
MVLRMKRAAIIVLAIATLVLIVLPSAYPLASTSKSTTGPNVITTYSKPAVDITGPSNSPSGGGTGGGGGGTDQGDADGLSGLKIKPGTNDSFGIGITTDRIAITLMMWWRYMVLIR